MADTLEVTGTTSNRLDVNGQGFVSQLVAQGTTAATGARGPKGDKGDKGEDGSHGFGIPLGGSTGQVLAKGSDADGIAVWVNPPEGGAATYDVRMDTTAQANLTSSGRSALSGAVNGTNVTFTVPGAYYAPNSLEVYLNGVLQVPGDAIIETSPATGVFTFSAAPPSGSQLYVRYYDASVDTIAAGTGSGSGVSEAYVQGAIVEKLTAYATTATVTQSLNNYPTTPQVNTAIDQKLVAYQDNTATRIVGGNRLNYLSATTPTGQDADWAQIGALLTNASGSLWFKQAVVAPTPTPGPTADYDAHDELLLAEAGFKAMHLNTEYVPTDHGTPEVATSRAFARALTMAVIARDQTMYNNVRDSAIAKTQRKNTFSGQTTLLSCFGRTYNITTNAVTDWGVDGGDTLMILGAAIRAWNLWGQVKDKDLANGLCYDIKNYLVNTDEGRAYLVMDDTQKAVPNGHHLDAGAPIWANDLSGINPVIFRMAKTYTGDAIFDQLLNGYYDLLNKATNNTGGLPTSWSLPPHYVAYKPADHSVSAITSGSHGWTTSLTTNFDTEAMRCILHAYEDYKIYGDSRANSFLHSTLQTFVQNHYVADGAIYSSYTHTGTANTATELSYVYRIMYLLTSLHTDLTVAEDIVADKIAYPTATSGANHYFTYQIAGTTAASTRDDDQREWLAESCIVGTYQDIALYGSNPNAGTTAPPGTTPVDQGGGTTTTPPSSTGTGSTVNSFYNYGTAPNLDQATRQTIARGEYDKWKTHNWATYNCNPDGSGQTTLPDGQWRTLDLNVRPDGTEYSTTMSGLRGTVSEGIGFGMLATAFFGNPALPVGIKDTGAQAIFDGFWKYYKAHMNANGLMNWSVTSNGTTNGTGGATDGDLDAALGLVMAHRFWGSAGAINYGTEAATLIRNIRDHEFVPLSGHPNPNYLTNGDQWGFDNPTYFPDYFRPGHLREFYNHTGDTRWIDIINTNYPIALGSFYSGTGNAKNVNGLMTDIDRTGNRVGSPILSYNNLRYPWAIAADYVWNGTGTNALAHDMPNLMVTRAKVVYGTNPTAPSPTGDGVYNPYNPGTSGIVAEPAIDYTWWNGNYRNAAYVQAYGVAGIVDAAHKDWAAACMQWLAADTEVSYFNRGVSVMATMLMSGIMVPAKPTSPGSTTTTGDTSTGTTTPTPVVVTPPPTNLPQGIYDLAVDANSTVKTYADGLSAGTKKDRLEWVASIPQGFWSGIDWDATCAYAAAYINASVAQNKVPQVLSYSIPGRDLGQYSAGGATNRAAYETWIGHLKDAIGNNKCILAYEPDSLTQLDGLSDDLKTGRLSMMTWAIQYLKSNCPNLYLYVDVGHSAWKTVQQAADLLHQVKVENANGFAINISNFRPDTELITYGQQICAALNLPNARFVFDSGRNGNPNIPSWRWANPADTRFGRLPQFGNTGVDKCDGWLWWKRPGESDGNNGDGAPVAGAFWSTYLYNDSKADNIGTDPNNDLVSATSGMAQRPPTPGVDVQGAHI